MSGTRGGHRGGPEGPSVLEVVADGNDPQTWLRTISTFFDTWASDCRVDRVAKAETSNTLFAWPAAMQQWFSHAAAVYPLSAKVLLLQTGIAPATAGWARESNVRRDSHARCRGARGLGDWRGQIDAIVSLYGDAVQRQDARAVSAAERTQLVQFLGQLPPVVVARLHPAESQPDEVRFLLRLLGFVPTEPTGEASA